MLFPENGSPATFGEDVAFLRNHTDVIVLTDEQSTTQVALAPAWQGRVMTSTAENDSGRSFGWINRELIASGQLRPHINVFGGEDRLWLGPEGGQFSIFFAKGAPFDTDHWFVPRALDTMPFQTVRLSRNSAEFAAEFRLTNYSGTQFQVAVKRDIRLLNNEIAWANLGLMPLPDVSVVAYESNNTLINAGKEPWRRATGLLSIWILGMFTPSPHGTVVVPIKPGPDTQLGPKVTSNYFGALPPERLRVAEDAVFLRGDGQFRSKIGVSPRRSLGKLASYDAEHQALTITQFAQPSHANDYVNSIWKLQDNPYGGDAINAYNDGPTSPGAKPLGPFFELESSSPAAALSPQSSIEHTHRTIHLTGPEGGLDTVANTVLGVSLSEIQAALHEQ